MRSQRRRHRVGHGARIVCLDGRLARAAAALHELQRVLPELQLLLACYRRERLHRGNERCELLHDGVVRGRHALVPELLLELRRCRGAVGARCMPLPGAAAALPAVTGGRSSQLPEGSDRTRRAKAR